MKKIFILSLFTFYLLITGFSTNKNSSYKTADLYGTWCIAGESTYMNNKWVITRKIPEYPRFIKIKITAKKVELTNADGSVLNVYVDNQTAYFDTYDNMPSFMDEKHVVTIKLLNKNQIEYHSDGEYWGGDVFERCE